MKFDKIFKKNDGLKEINLLPEKYRFDIVKQQVIKIAFMVFVLNIIILGAFYYDGKNELNYLKSVLSEKQDYDSNLKNMIGNLDVYKNEKNESINRLKLLKDVENELRRGKISSNSALLDLWTLNSLLPEYIQLNEINYTSGVFKLSGTAGDPRNFYEYYNSIEKNEMIEFADFENLEKTETGVKFGLVVRLKGIL